MRENIVVNPTEWCGNLEKQVDALLRFQNRVPQTSIMQVIRQEVSFGDGTKKNPVRQVTRYWDLDGNFLFQKDDFMCEQQEDG